MNSWHWQNYPFILKCASMSSLSVISVKIFPPGGFEHCINYWYVTSHTGTQCLRLKSFCFWICHSYWRVGPEQGFTEVTYLSLLKPVLWTIPSPLEQEDLIHVSNAVLESVEKSFFILTVTEIHETTTTSPKHSQVSAPVTSVCMLMSKQNIVAEPRIGWQGITFCLGNYKVTEQRTQVIKYK